MKLSQRVRQLYSSRCRAYGCTPWSPAQLTALAAWYEADPAYCYTDGAAQLNGLGYVNYLTRSDGSAARTGDIDFWVAGWVKTGNYSVPQFSVLQKYREFILEWRGAHNCFYFKTTRTSWLDTFVTSTSGVLPNNTWCFVVAWHDSASDAINIITNNSQPITVSTGGSLADYYTGGDDIYIGIAGEENTNTCLDSVCFGKSPPGGIAGIISTISSRLYNSGNGLTYADLTTQEKTDWGLVSFWNLNEASGTRNDSHGTNHLTDNNSVGLAAGIARGQCGDGDPIALWQDRSGNGYHLTQSDILKRPTLRLVSGKWCVRFDGVNDGMTCNSVSSVFAGTQNSYETVCTVNNCTDSTGVVWAAASSADNTPLVFHRPRISGVISSYRRGDGSTPDYILGGASGAGKYLLGWAFSGTNLTSYINGNLDILTGIVTTGSMNVDMFNVGRLDRFGGSSEHVSADIGTVLLTSAVMSNSERVVLNDWLNNKYIIY